MDTCSNFIKQTISREDYGEEREVLHYQNVADNNRAFTLTWADWPAPIQTSYFIGPYNLHYLIFSGIRALLCHHPYCSPSQLQILFGQHIRKFFWNKRKRLHKKKIVQILQNLFGTPTWFWRRFSDLPIAKWLDFYHNLLELISATATFSLILV